MHWKLKAAIQNVMGRLPSDLANPIYYGLQRSCGGLRRTSPVSRFKAGIEMAHRLRLFERSVGSAAFLEVGTGHQLNLPLSLWLCGAGRITTVDLNRYLRERLVMDDISYLRNHKQQIRDLFFKIPQYDLFDDRFNRLVNATSLGEVLALTNIRYLAPADAGRLDMKDGSIDFHISYTVLEHVPAEEMKRIFREGRRVLKPDGLFVHCIDFSDHFAHSDSSVSTLNFLQFSESDWNRLAGNRYMYHNRLRVDEFRELAAESGLEILALDARVDEAAMEVLRNGFPLNERFVDKDFQTNAATEAWLVASPGQFT